LRDAIQSKTDCLPVQEPGPRNPPAAAQADPAQSTGPLESTDLLTLAINHNLKYRYDTAS